MWSMDPGDILQSNYMILIYHLRPVIESIIKYLLDEQVLDVVNTENILSRATDTQRTRLVLQWVKKNPLNAQETLYAATLYAQAWQAADILEPSKKPHANLYPKREPLPDEWPSLPFFEALAENNLIIKHCDKEVMTAKSYERMTEFFTNPKKYHIYDMRNEVKGRALIINNHHFSAKNYKTRHGTERDEKALRMLLSYLHFDVVVHHDLTKTEMNAALDEESQRDHTKDNCFILVILSHGRKDEVVGVDGESLRIENIIQKFDDERNFGTIPKLIIIQACRGSERSGVTETMNASPDEAQGLGHKVACDSDLGVSTSDQYQGDLSSPSQGQTETEMSDGDQDTNQDENEGKDENEIEDNRTRMANHMDHILIAQPSTEGNISWRMPDKGSWFIQAFVYVMANYAYSDDLVSLMTQVNWLVSRAKGEEHASTPATKTKRQSRQSRKCKVQAITQVPEFKSRLDKRLYFFPGMKEDNVK